MGLRNFLRTLIITSSLILSSTIALSQSANDGFRMAKEKELKQLLEARERLIERNRPTAVADKRIAVLRKELAELDPAKDQEKVTLRRQLASYQRIRNTLIKAGKSTEKVDEKIAQMQKQLSEKPDDAKVKTTPKNERYAKNPKLLKSKISSMKKYIATRKAKGTKVPQSYIDRLVELEALLAKIEK